MEIHELKDLREYYGGDGRGRAINRHSTRVYQVDDSEPLYYLDRNLSTNPPHFSLYFYNVDRRVSHDRMMSVSGYVQLATYLPVESREFWGDGLTWHQAEDIAKEVIRRHWEV